MINQTISEDLNEHLSGNHEEGAHSIMHLGTVVMPQPVAQYPLVSCNLGRRDSNSSVRSLVSYNSVRESLGKMHAYVERVSKIDSFGGA
jgi:hypothetical protein